MRETLSSRALMYCAAVAIIFYWFPFAYLDIVDRGDRGRGGMLLVFFFPLILASIAIATQQVYRALRSGKNKPVKIISFLLFAVTASPLGFMLLGIWVHRANY